MATVTHVFTIDYVAQFLDEDLGLLQAIVDNPDNLAYGNIINVRTGPDRAITALTNDGIDELQQMLVDARRSTEHWDNFLNDFVSDPDIIARVKATSSR